MKRTNVLYGNYNICYCESLVYTFLNLMIAVESSVPHFLEFTGYKCWISRIFRHRFLPRTMQVKSSGIPLNIRNFFYMWLSDWFPSQYQVWRCFKRSLLRYYLGIIALFIFMRAFGSCRPYILGFTGLDWISRIFLHRFLPRAIQVRFLADIRLDAASDEGNLIYIRAIDSCETCFSEFGSQDQ